MNIEREQPMEVGKGNQVVVFEILDDLRKALNEYVEDAQQRNQNIAPVDLLMGAHNFLKLVVGSLEKDYPLPPPANWREVARTTFNQAMDKWEEQERE